MRGFHCRVPVGVTFITVAARASRRRGWFWPRRSLCVERSVPSGASAMSDLPPTTPTADDSAGIPTPHPPDGAASPAGLLRALLAAYPAPIDAGPERVRAALGQAL